MAGRHVVAPATSLLVSSVGAAMIYLPCEIRAQNPAQCSDRATTAVALLGGGGAAAATYQTGLMERSPRDEVGPAGPPVVPPRGLVMQQPTYPPMDERPVDGR